MFRSATQCERNWKMHLSDNGAVQKVNSDSDELADQRLTSFHEEVGVIQKIAVIIIKPRGERNTYVRAYTQSVPIVMS